MKDIEIPLGKRTKSYRFWEIFPGALTWTIIFLPAVLALVSPTLSAYYVVFIMIFWLVKAFAMVGRVIQGYRRLNQQIDLDWPAKVKELSVASQDNDDVMDPNDVVHLALVAVYNESYEIVEPTIKSVGESSSGTENIILAIAYEERGGSEVEASLKRIQKEYKDKFKDFLIYKHPDGLPDEVIGKGGNITWAARDFTANYMKKKRLKPENILVTTLDADNRPHHNYFAAAAFAFAANPDRKHISYQPIPMYLNNIWDVPAPMRVVATGNSFFMVIQSVRPHLLRNFSSHAQGLDALIETDFWSVRTIVEDGHQFWRSYFRFDGKHDVVPIHVPIYQDAVLASTYKKTLIAQFIQLRRWAWGASDIAYVATKGWKNRANMPKVDLFAKFMRLLEAHITWSTIPFILAFASWTPRLLSPNAADSIVAWQLPTLAQRLNTVLTLAIFVSIYLSIKILPPRPDYHKKRRKVWMFLQWVWLPPISIIYSGLSAINAQTRLMFGWYLDRFDVTEKAVHESKKAK